jgi:hypothetical protein
MFFATTENPYTVLTLIAAPAVFTNAASVLTLGTGNRLARVVNRTRVIAQELQRGETQYSKSETLEATWTGWSGEGDCC